MLVNETNARRAMSQLSTTNPGPELSDGGDPRRDPLLRLHDVVATWNRQRVYKRGFFKDHEENRFWHKRDRSEFERDRPPRKENVRLVAVTVCEVYTPAHLDQLIKGAERMGFEADWFGSRRKRVGEWVDQHQRRMSGGGATWPIGHLIQPSDQRFRFGGKAIHYPLPESLVDIGLTLHSAAPGLVVLACTGTFVEHVQQLPTQVMNTLYLTEYTPHKNGGGSSRPGDMVRRDHASALRQSLRSDVECFVRRHAPGYFARQTDAGQMPALEYYLTSIARPMDGLQNDPPANRYLDSFDLSMGWGAWQEPSGRRIRMFGGISREGHSNAVVVASRVSDAAQAAERGRKASWHSIVHHLVDYDEGLTLTWALFMLTDKHEQRLAEIRTQMSEATRRGWRRLRRLQSVEASLRREAADLGPLTSALLNDLERSRFPMLGVAPIRSCDPRPSPGEERELNKEMSDWIVARLRRLRAAEEELGRLLANASGVENARANARLQQMVFALTIITVLVGIISIVATVSPDTVTNAYHATQSWVKDLI